MSDESFKREIVAKFFDGQDVKDLQDEYGLSRWQIEHWIRTLSVAKQSKENNNER